MENAVTDCLTWFDCRSWKYEKGSRLRSFKCGDSNERDSTGKMALVEKGRKNRSRGVRHRKEWLGLHCLWSLGFGEGTLMHDGSRLNNANW